MYSSTDLFSSLHTFPFESLLYASESATVQMKATRITLLLSQTGDTDAQRDLCEHGPEEPPMGCEKETRGRTNTAIHFTDRETESQQNVMCDRTMSLGRSKHLRSH